VLQCRHLSYRFTEDTMKNVGRLSTDGMIETDRTILQIMLDKKFSSIE
jgi:L-cysteine desulfidase